MLEFLKASQGGLFLDCTFGGGGHTKAILEASAESKVVALDQDIRAIERAEILKEKFQERLSLHHTQFSDFDKFIDQQILFDGIIADLGTSSDQLAEGRGFSFSDQESLDMRMNEQAEITANFLVNTLSEKELFTLLKKGGVGKEARPASRAIVQNRPFDNASQLAEVIKRAVERYEGGKKRNPATLVFQAIRIAVNQEFDEIDELLKKVPKHVKPGARLVVISFHSLEDRLVARAMRKWQGESAPALWGGMQEVKTLGKLLTSKAVKPGEEEIDKNRRSRSAMLRAFEFLGCG